jgi:hypothetical protein
MKTQIIAVVFFALALASAASPEIVRLGSEVDFAGSAISALPGAVLVPDVTGNAKGSEVGEHDFRLFGWAIVKVDPATWLTIPPSFVFSVKQALKSEGWNCIFVTPEPNNRQEPTYFVMQAERKSETLALFVTIFPSKDGVIRIAYSQERRH